MSTNSKFEKKIHSKILDWTLRISLNQLIFNIFSNLLIIYILFLRENETGPCP